MPGAVQLPVAQINRRVVEGFHERGIMRRKHNRGADLVQRAKKMHEFHAQLMVEVAGRFIR